MFKKTISILLALITVLSVFSIAGFAVSAEEVTTSVTYDEATNDEATVDEPKLLLTPYSDVAEGTVIGKMGDVNDDDKFNIKDATVIRKYLAKLEILSERFKALADVDDNKKINIRDATALQKYIANIDVDNVVSYTLYETGTHKHSFAEAVCEVTCTNDGYTLKSCICGEETKENVVAAKGHDYKKTLYTTTCVKDGYTLHACKNCNSTYKTNITGATGVHYFGNDRTNCVHCGIKKTEASFNTLKDYVIKKGDNSADSNVYMYELKAVSNGDLAYIGYDKSTDALAVSCVYFVEEYMDMVTVAFTKEGYCEFYVLCSDAFESAGLIDMAKFSMSSKNVKDIEYNIVIDISEKTALKNTVAYIKGALSTYEYNQSKLPVTIKDLGFLKFTA
ncbi:MAG: dockerin type I repeat-containing protein [Clostridia bacterium]|nr:dockerin type I repeat-containing protein [Clostridia bacterium]